MLRPILVALAFSVAFISAPSSARPPSAWADTPGDAGVVTVDDAGVRHGATVQPQGPIADPIAHPAEAWDELRTAKRTGWPFLIWAALAMLGKALAYARDKLAKVPVVGALAALLAKGKGAMLVAAAGAIGAAGYEALIGGGSLIAALYASVVALAGVTHSTTQPPKTT